MHGHGQLNFVGITAPAGSFSMHVGKLVSRKSNVFCKTCAKKGYTKLETIYTYRVGTGCAMDFPAFFSLDHLLTAR
jgi:hypothetical protein